MAYEKPDYQNDAIAIERSKRACDQYRRRKIICCGRAIFAASFVMAKGGGAESPIDSLCEDVLDSAPL